MKRRSLLAGLGAISVAGCLGNGAPTESGSGVILNGVVITNFLNEDKTVEIIIKDQQETYIDKEVLAKAGKFDSKENRYYGGAILNCEWPASPGSYTARARLNGKSTWVEIETTGEYEDNCEQFEYVIEENGLTVTSRSCKGHAYACGYNE